MAGLLKATLICVGSTSTFEISSRSTWGERVRSLHAVSWHSVLTRSI
jgi:hypothetical protein